MQLSLSQLEVLKPANWSPKCRQNTLIGVISMVALGAIVFLSSSQARAWLRFQFMTESLACKKLKTAIENNDPVAAKAILKMFSNSEKIKEYLHDPKAILLLAQMTELSADVWKIPIDENGDTVLHEAMTRMVYNDEWEAVAEALLAKPYAAELLQVKNNREESPWFYVKYDREAILFLAQMTELSAEVWKTPIDENGNTVLHQAMLWMDSLGDWKEVAKALLAKPYAAELLQVKNNQGKNPWFYVKYDREAILFLAKMPELPEEAWKISIDENGNTMLHKAMANLGSSDKWRAVAEALLAKPFADELKQVKNNAGDVPSDIGN